MVKVLVIILSLFFCVDGRSQTWDEWFNQKSTQKKYLIQQIAALQVYTGYLEKGYEIARKGLGTISDIKDGHWKLDIDFFNSLSQVNPKVKGYSKVAGIVSLQLHILQTCKLSVTTAMKNNIYPVYYAGVFDRLKLDVNANTNYLIDLITNGSMQLSDEERIKRIDDIYKDTQDQVVFSDGFNAQLKILVVQKQKEQADADVLRSLYNIKK